MIKKLSILLSAVLLLLVACDKEDEDTEKKLSPTAAQKGFCLEWTSITCSICGSTGGPLLKQFSEEAPNGAMIALHVNQSDSMKIPNSTYWAFSDDRPTGGGIPKFYVGDDQISTSDVDAMTNLLDQGDAVAGVDIKHEIDGSSMKIDTKTKFFENSTGEYHLSVFVLEDGIDGSDSAPQGYDQAGGGADYKHNFVLRGEATDTMGELIASDPDQNKTVSKSYSINIDPSWDDVYPVAVIWKYDANANIKYSYVNSIR